MEDIARGATWKSLFPCPQFTTTTFPLIATNTIILGVCGAGLEVSDPQEDGWFVSDFYAFNYLLHGLGSHQTWFSAVSPTDLLRRYGSFFHGNPYKPRHAVLTDTLLNEGKITRPTVLSTGSMTEGVLRRLATLSELSHQTESPLLVLVFGHRQAEDKSIVIEHELDRHTRDVSVTGLLTIEDFRRATSQAKHVSLITTACFSGGWTVIPDLNITVVAAAGVDTESTSWPTSPSSQRAYGSIFASSAFCFLTDQTGVTGDMPTFNNMCRQMVDNLGNRLTRIPEDHEFSFSAHENDYSGPWSHVSAIPVGNFKARWEALETAAPAEPSMLNLDPGNPLWTNDNDSQLGSLPSLIDNDIQLPSPPSLFGGTFKSQTRFIQHVVRSHLATCQGDWEMAIGGKHGGILRRYLRNPCPDKAATQQVLHLIEWRNDVMELADTWIAVLQLPRPAAGKTCAHWDRRLALGDQARSRMRSISSLLKEHPLMVLVPETHDCAFTTTGIFSCGKIQFRRPRDYVAACMALAGLQDAEVVEALERCKAVCEVS